MYAKNSQFPKLTEHDKSTLTPSGYDAFKGGVPSYTLPAGNPHKRNPHQPAEQGPIRKVTPMSTDVDPDDFYDKHREPNINGGLRMHPSEESEYYRLTT